MMTAVAFALSFVFLRLASATRPWRMAARAPALLLCVGALIALVARGLHLPTPPAAWLSAAAEGGLAVLGFTAAAQLRISRLRFYCPSSFRLAVGGAPMFLIAASLTSFVMLPQLSLASSLLVGAALMLNGAAFDRRAVALAPAPAAIKAAVRHESAAILALGLPIAMLFEANATAAMPSEHALAPLFGASIAIWKGFAIGGALGLGAAYAGAYVRRRTMQRRALDGSFAALAGVAGFGLAPLLGGDAVIAALAAGLLWGEQTSATHTARLRLRQFAEQAVTPVAYFTFGCLAPAQIFGADFLTLTFALAAVTILRAGPRLAALQSSGLPPESQAFLAWFGGAPGAATALFAIWLTGNPAIVNADGALAVISLSVMLGVFAARATSRPLLTGLLRQTAMARKRRMFAG